MFFTCFFSYIYVPLSLKVTFFTTHIILQNNTNSCIISTTVIKLLKGGIVIFYLINYRNTNSCQCKSITELPLSEAKAVAEHLYQNSPCRAHRRFGPNFAQYYADRHKVEQWLFDNFKNSGGNPQSKHPLYFVFQIFCPKLDLLKHCFGIITIAINNTNR